MLNKDTQIETLTIHLKKSVSEYCNKNNITKEDIESYNKIAEEFVITSTGICSMTLTDKPSDSL